MPGNFSPKTFRKNGEDKAHKLTVLIASGDAGLRQQWALGLQDSSAIHAVSEYAEMERSITNSKPAVLLLDFDLPGLDQVKGLSALQHLSPLTKSIILASRQDEKEAISAFRAGAKGYGSKQIEPSLLRKLINVVQNGEIWVGRKTVSGLLAELTSLSESHQKDSRSLSEVYLKHLTPRELQIARLVGQGACNKEISSKLDISERTVKAHLTAIFQKLQISDRLRLGLFVNGRTQQINR
jgi:DNA-binding NarL/FixJ family response regulator